MMLETEIKLALIGYLGRVRRKEQLAYIEELEVNGGEVRADFVDVSNMHCYEIKSDRDTLTRLNAQGSRYGKVFDRITLVISEKHLANALAIIPEWWGVMVISNQTREPFRTIRLAKPNKQQEAQMLVTLLRREDALDLLEKSGGSWGWKSKSLYAIREHIAQTIALKELKSHVKSYLLDRQATLGILT